MDENARVPDRMPRLLALVHPVLSFVAIALLAATASLGLRSRERGGATLRPRHAKIAPWAAGVTIANTLLGVASVRLWRPDLRVADGPHFWLGVSVASLLALGAVLSRSVRRDERARLVHPMLGLAALLLALVQVFFGLSLVAP